MKNLDISKIVSTMTIEEKAQLLCGETFFRTRKLDKYGIPHMQLLDGGTGMNFEQLLSDWYGEFVDGSEFDREQLDNASRCFYEPNDLTDKEKELRDILEEKLKEKLGSIPAPGCYPPGIVLGSTWNRELVRSVGDALGMEANKYRVDCLLGTPNVNLLREPRNGRFFEGYSEDPYLAGELGSQLVKGVEGRGVAANVKHYAANNLEKNRIGIDQHISLRALREMYLPAFEKCAKAGAATFMTSYPSINGKNCTQNPWLLRTVLRGDFGYKGLNMTDWGACTGDSGDSVEAGIDLFMPGPWSPDAVIKAVEDGRLSRINLDLAVTRMLKFIDKYSHELNQFEDVESSEVVALGDEVNYKAASEGIVLLKNNGVLPISENSGVAILGSKELRIYGNGSAQVYTSRKGKLSDYIVKQVDESEVNEAGTVALVVCNMSSGEGTDRENLKLDSATNEALEKVKLYKQAGRDVKAVLVLNVPGPVELGEYVEYVDAIIAVYYPGGEGARALCDILYGRTNPSGHLTCSWPLRYEDTPAYLNYPNGFHCIYGEDIYVGYRGYQKKGVETLYPFGFGLSYTDFELKIVDVDKIVCHLWDSITVTYELSNIGNVDGAQVVQLYVSDIESRISRPVRELKGFDKVFVKAGETVRRSITVNINDFALYDDDLMKWIVEDGSYELSLGFNCEIMETSTRILLVDGTPEYRLGINMTVDELRKYPVLRYTLIKSIKDAGDDVMALIMTERYTPMKKIYEALPNCGKYSEFISMCEAYKKK